MKIMLLLLGVPVLCVGLVDFFGNHPNLSSFSGCQSSSYNPTHQICKSRKPRAKYDQSRNPCFEPSPFHILFTNFSTSATSPFLSRLSAALIMGYTKGQKSHYSMLHMINTVLRLKIIFRNVSNKHLIVCVLLIEVC